MLLLNPVFSRYVIILFRVSEIRYYGNRFFHDSLSRYLFQQNTVKVYISARSTLLDARAPPVELRGKTD